MNNFALKKSLLELLHSHGYELDDFEVHDLRPRMWDHRDAPTRHEARLRFHDLK